MKVLIFGGTGNVGAVLKRYLPGMGHKIRVVTRRPKDSNDIGWDGKTLGPWVSALQETDAVINLAGRPIKGRYNPQTMHELVSSRVDSTSVIGEAISQCENPPKVWLQASAASLYSHRFDAANDEKNGIIGGNEPGAPAKYKLIVDLVQAWEAALWQRDLLATRRVALRISLVMSNDKGSVFDVLCGLAKKGLGGALGNGKQHVSWIHEADFARGVDFALRTEAVTGPVNMCAPNPLMQKEFARVIREELGVPIGLPAMAWMVEMGCLVMGAESELVMKSRHVVSSVLAEQGFKFEYPTWSEACHALISAQKGS